MSNNNSQAPKLERVTINGEIYQRISDVDAMRPFFMSIVSDSNHWMFIGSNGGLSAGRKDAESALFPYYTDDKIIESAEITGSKTIFQVLTNGQTQIWEPFSIRFSFQYNTTRNLYKNIYGNKILFEEVNHDLNLTFRYEWNSSDKYGFVKKSTITNNGGSTSEINLLDGIQNILPYSVSSGLQNTRSNLVDAYKRNELMADVGLGIYALSAIIVDKAEPSEALKANIAWTVGLENPSFLLSSLQLDDFRKGQQVDQESDIKAEKGAFFVNKKVNLESDKELSWFIVANVNQNQSSIALLSKEILENNAIVSDILESIETGTTKLIALNAAADGLQLTNDKLRDTRHFANSLFNIMRGGIFDSNYQIERADFLGYLHNTNKEVYARTKEHVLSLPETFTTQELKKVAFEHSDVDFTRLSIEYLPLKFSRRHGDPSRPWNQFSINTHNEKDGSKILDYEGNWRDIFQNWEALGHSFPEFTDNMIAKFLNASTFDGYNPYRVTKNGIDWETIEPDDPWSYIGYWGDHQIIYLLKFLEFAQLHSPEKLDSYFDKEMFVYANVPYKIKSYEDILANPKDTIDFDAELDHKIEESRKKIGADSVLISNNQGEIHHVNFIEKILATVLSKVSNFIPEAGIWMNTQRPEWNDANNALVGNGVSMVTLYYLRRFLKFFGEVLADTQQVDIQVSEELLTFFNDVVAVIEENEKLLDGSISDTQRRTILDGLGNAGSNYRSEIYQNGFSGKKQSLTIEKIISFVGSTNSHLEHSITQNQRADKLYHAYNLMTVYGNDKVRVSYLSEMLEGQVAVLSSGYLTGTQTLEVLDALKGSALFRPDQYSYLLYPNKDLPGFTERNNIPKESVESSTLFTSLLEKNNKSIVVKDVNGNYHFNDHFKNAEDLKEALNELSTEGYRDLVEKDRQKALDIFEEVFNHKAFTGRSGTFYGYEGLGSIYWHMVSKLQLAVQESCLQAIKDEAGEAVIGRLLEHYYEINQSIGIHKSPKLYGAFPTDPYSHTPAGKGAQQPGMTGQVKEDILCRFGELGVFVEDGCLTFNPCLLRRDEFLKQPETLKYIDVQSNWKEISLSENSLCYSYCQVPIIYKIASGNSIEVHLNSGESVKVDSLSLDKGLSHKVFGRTNEVARIEVEVIADSLR
ncbi:MAG: hypothetical protein RIA69_04990 [Cyclobacteriaceae bacterium]